MALGVGFYAAFLFELEGAASTGVCILILAQPAQGMVLSKSIYRFAGTIVGVLVAICLTALFPQDRTMLLAAFALFMALQTALGSILRDFRSYGCILAGYTVAIVSIANIDSPELVFTAAVNRVAAILVGIAAIGLVNAFLATAESSRSLISKLREATKDIIEMAIVAIDQRRPPDASDCIALSARLMPLRSEISYATPEQANGRARARGGRSALLALFEMLSAIQAVGTGLKHLKEPSPVIDATLELVREALRSQRPERYAPRLEGLAGAPIAAGSLSVAEAYVLDRLHFMIETLGNLRDGLRSVRMGWLPQRNVTLPVHQDWFAVVINAFRLMIAVGIISVLCVWTGIAGTAQAILFTAVFVSLGAVLPNPSVMGKAAIFGMPAVIVAGIGYAFFVFPMINGYPLFILSLAPLVVVMCWLIKIGLPGAGLIFGVQTLVLITPANVQTIDPPAFVETSTMLLFSGIAIYLSFLLVLPVDPAQRRLRLALGVGRALRNALADEGKLEQPRASLQYDRLAQFKTWQGDHMTTLARRKTMRRLVDIGNLGLAVRRAWRGLDRAKPYAAVELDRRARATLPTLSPTETFALAQDYIRSAQGREGPPALALVHAGAALYGTAFLTSDEQRLLKRVQLLQRTI